MRILLADDHQVVREGLKQILKNLGLGNFIEEAKDGNEALAILKSGEFDLVILDISMPGLSGLDVLKCLVSNKIKEKVLFVSVHPQKQYAIQALKLGAGGYISKDSTSEELELAIKMISAGKKYLSSDIIGILVSDLNNKNNLVLHERLSEREFEVMCLLAKGIRLKDI